MTTTPVQTTGRSGGARVSVVIPTYQRERWIRRAIESALSQTYGPVEVIVVDDGSTDGTAGVVRGMGERVRYMRIENSGPSRARNVGVEAATGEFIAFLDSDDAWHPEKIAVQVEAMDNFGQAGLSFTDAAPSDGAGARVAFFEKSGFAPGGDVVFIDDPMRVAMLARQPVLLPTMMIRRAVWDGVGGFDELLRVGEDTDLIFRLALATKFCAVNRVLAFYGVSAEREESMGRVVKSDPFVRPLAEERVYANLKGRLNPRCPAMAVATSRLADVRARLGMLYAERGQWPEARQALWHAVAAKPSGRTMAKLGLSIVSPGLLRWVACRRVRTQTVLSKGANA